MAPNGPKLASLIHKKSRLSCFQPCEGMVISFRIYHLNVKTSMVGQTV